MRRRRFLTVLGLGGAAGSVSGCVDGPSGSPAATIDAVTVANTSDEPVELSVEVSDGETAVFTETVSLSERYGERTNVAIAEPVAEPGSYTVSARYDDWRTDVDATDHATEAQPHVYVVFRVVGGGGLTADVRTSEERLTPSER